ncbi:MAG: ABC transporter permease [Propionivibrio sp.]|jgi:simple sugar transport system permease protein|nr:ABC transporter permease [Propionivibrio sp.]
MDDLISLLNATLRVSPPLILCALAGLFSERSGVFDIGLEGKMLAGAFAAASVAVVSGSPWLGLAVSIAVTLTLAMLHAYISISQNGNQTISGMAINIIASGLTPVLAIAWFHQGGITPALPTAARYQPIILPFAAQLRDVPIIGTLYSGLLSGHTPIVYFTALTVPLTAWVLYRSRFGLRLRAVGENPHAVDTAGISVARLRYTAQLWNGLLAGFAGSYLSTAIGAGFIQDMSAGRGFLALAALVAGKWRPVPTMLACLFFAFADALQFRLQGYELPLIGKIPVSLVQSFPYLLTVVVLAGFVGKAVAPRAGGIPYIKSR